MKILLVEDDRVMAENLKILLKDKGYLVDLAGDSDTAIDLVFSTEYDVILLDWMLPKITGEEVCKTLRENDIKTPIIFLTAKNQIEDKVKGLDIGADDYITKPFIIDELLARIRSLIRRNYNNSLQSVITIGKLQIDTSKCEVTSNGVQINLSPKIYSLLEFLGVNKNTVVTRAMLTEHLWDENTDLFSNVIDAHIKNLRKELANYIVNAEIKTIKGKGYMLCETTSTT